MTVNQIFSIPLACDDATRTLHIKTGSIDNYQAEFYAALVGPLGDFKTEAAISFESVETAIQDALDYLAKEVFVAEQDSTGAALSYVAEALKTNGVAGLREYELLAYSKLNKRLVVQVHRTFETFSNTWRVFPDGMPAHYAECDTVAKMEKYVKHLEESGAVVIWLD